MPTQIQWRRGTTAQTASFTGAVAEVTVDTDKKTLVVHDGVTPGGFALAKESAQQDALAYNHANASFDAANSAGSYANSAFAAANAAGSSTLTQYAAGHANASFNLANTLVLVNTTQNNSITASFTAANSAGVYANGAFAAANAATATDTTQNNSITAAFVAANSAGVYANGAFDAANAATATDTTQNNSITASFTAANSAGVYANGAFAVANSAASYSNTVNTTQNNSITAAFVAANSAGVYANGAFAAANSASDVATSAGIYANGAFAAANNVAPQIQPAFNTANAAFIRANNSLDANNGGTIAGNLSITGNLTVLGNTFTISATQIVANDSMIVLGLGNYTGDVLDIGFTSHYNDGANAHTGLIRDAGSKEYQLFEGYTPEVGANNNININDASFKIATLNANLHSQLIRLNGQDLQTYVDNAYAKANNEAGVNLTQNTNITTAQNTGDAAFAKANNEAGVNATQNNSITAAFNAANNEAGVNVTQNNSIAAAFTQANSVYLPSVTRLDVTNSGSSAFLFDQYSGNNPTIFIRAGETIAFNLNVTGHPFLIRVSNGGAQYDTGLTHVSGTGTVVTGSSAQAKESGTLYWKVPAELAGSTYVYQCQIHGGMVGNIIIEIPNEANAAFMAANSASIYANGAFNKANTDFTNINISSDTYGNATYIPIITVSSNGRINTITTIASAGGSGGGGLEQVFLLMGA
jgi:hypothetical protein